MKKKRKKSKHTLQIERMDRIWSEIIKLKAEYKSELSGDPTRPLGAHHVHGKSTNYLRYDLRGGICLNNVKEHKFGVHSTDPSISGFYQDRIREYIKQREGENIFDILDLQKNTSGGNLDMIEIVLKEELKRFE